MEVRVKVNWHDHNLYCCYSKERIEIGEEFCVVYEELYDAQIVEKAYKKENLPIEEDDYFEGED